MQNSLAKRLTYRIMAVVMVMLAVITGIVFFSVRDYMLNEAQQRYLGILLKENEELRRRLSDVYVAAKNNIHDIERDIDNPDLMASHMERIVQQNNTLVSCGLLFKPDYYPQKGRYFVPFATRDSARTVNVSRIDSLFSSYATTDWYRERMKADEADWTGAYFEDSILSINNHTRLLTTYSIPVHNKQNEPVALLCADLSLESMRREMMEDAESVNMRFEKALRHKSFGFVIDRKGTYIIHPNETRMLKDNFRDHIEDASNTLLTRMTNGESGSAMVKIEGVPSWIYYRNVKYVDWTFVIVVPQEVIFYNGRMLNTLILLSMLFGLAAIYFICRHMIRKTTKPLHRFALSADQVALGNFSSPLPDIKGYDEVRLLHDAFANMQTSLSIYVEQLRETTTSKVAMERELKIAHGIQMAMLPKTFPPYPERKDLDLYASQTPARDVGGDLYDYFLRENRLFFCIGDVTGKGVPAALLMAVMRAMFRAEARRADKAADIVETMNRNLGEEQTSGYFVTMFVGILNLQTGYLDYCNAGHEAPLLAGEALPIKPNLPVGALPDWNYEGQEAWLKDGDTLFLYTDGLSEAKNAEKHTLGRKRVLSLAQAHRGSSAQQLVEIMEAEVRRHAADAEQSDDITLLAIRWVPGVLGSGINAISMQPSMDDIDKLAPFVLEAAQRAGIDEKETKRLRLAVEEVVANVINHSGATRIQLQSDVEDEHLVLIIDDDGEPFDPTLGSSTDLNTPADLRPPGGLGIIFLHKMSDGLEYQRTDGHNVLKIKKLNSNN